MSQRNQALELLEVLHEGHCVSYEDIAEYLIRCYMSSDDALDALKSYARDWDIDLEDDEEEEEEEEIEEVKEEKEEEEEIPHINEYRILKQKHQKEVNEFPILFAFSARQFKEGMEKFGLTESDTDKIISIGAGGYVRKNDYQAFSEMLSRQKKELQDAIDADEDGKGFIFDMFDYELANHEYSYTQEIDDTLNALGLTYDEIMASKKLSQGLKLARMSNRNQ